MGDSSPGRFQLLAGFLLCCVQLPVTFTDHLLLLYSVSPMHRCRVRHEHHSKNSSLAVGENEYRPIEERNGELFYSSCLMYVDPKDHSQGTQSCLHGWEFRHAELHWTLVTEFSLVCEREYLINIVPYVYLVGTMVGAVLFGILGDHFGRKAFLLVALLLHTAVGIALHFVPSYIYFIVGYGVQGMFLTGIQCLSVILLVETFAFAYHLQATVIMSGFWPVGILILALLSWIIRNWRYTQVAVTSPAIVCIGYFWLLPRSLPWLLTENRLSEAEDQMLQFARFNKTRLPDNFRQHLQQFAKAIRTCIGPRGSSHSLDSAVSSPKIRRYTFVMYYIWFVVSLEPNTSPAEVPALKDNKFAILFVKGLMDIGMNIILYFLSLRFGPRFTQGTMLILGGSLCITSALIDYQLPLPLSKANITDSKVSLLAFVPPVLANLGKTVIRATVATAFFFSVKIFPTGVRAIGLGSCLLWSRGSQLLGHHISSMKWESSFFLQIAVCGGLCAFGGVLTFLLPSKTYRSLPNVAQEIEHDIVLEKGLQKSRRLDSDVSSRSIPHEEDTQASTRHLCQLNVEELPTLRLESRIGQCKRNPVFEISDEEAFPEDIPGPSHVPEIGLQNINRYFIGHHEDCKDDDESRLTDLEDEITKIWDLNPNRDDSNFSTESSMRDFHRGNVKHHFSNMNETSF